jgi:hypothetical protein
MSLLEKIEEKLSSVSKKSGILVPEPTAFKLTFWIGVVLLIILILIMRFVLPRTSLQIEVSGPETTKTGELISYTVTCKNTGNVTLEGPELVFSYPPHSFPEKGELIETIGPDDFDGFIYPGEEEVFTFETRLFGKEGEEEEVKSWLNYKRKGDPSLQISRVATLSTQISEVPMGFELDLPSKIPILPKKTSLFGFKIRYASFVDYSLSNLKVKVDYPSDLILTESRPQIAEEGLWEISLLEKSETGEIEIWGEFPEGQEVGKEMDFAAKLYLPIYGEDVLLQEAVKKSQTFKPVFFISQKINGQSEYITYPGETLHYQVYFQNVDENPQRNLTLISALEGDLYDFFTIETPEGENRDGDNSIVWTGENTPELRYLQPGEEGEVEFWVKLKSDQVPKDISDINAVVKNRVSLAGFEKEFRSKVNSRIEILQEGYYGDKYGFFENFGFPPEVNKTTSYTIVWKIKNYYNLVKGAKIEARLPSRVSVKSTRSSQGKVDIKVESFRESLYPGVPEDFRFESILSYGMRSDGVKYLQIVLKEQVPKAYPSSVPATGYFGSVTFGALLEFQQKYRKEILTPQGLTTGTGYTDELTRLKLNELLIEGIPITANDLVWEIKVAELISEVTMSGTDQWTEGLVFARDDAIDTSLPDDPTVKDGEIR